MKVTHLYCVKLQGLIPGEDDYMYGLGIFDTTNPKKPRKKPWQTGVDRRYILTRGACDHKPESTQGSFANFANLKTLFVLLTGVRWS
jgi:hypothetical protein